MTSARPGPDLLIEQWFPVEALGIESRRESEIPSALPPIRFLHTWWARRPIVASTAAVVFSVLPPWTPELRQRIVDPRTNSEDAYRRWALQLCGINGDPVFARAAIDAAKDEGRRVVEKDVYGYERAYLNSPSYRNLELFHEVLTATWGTIPSLLDPTAGGGSIPYAGVRLGVPSTANDLNAVAACVLRAGVEIAAEQGTQLSATVRVNRPGFDGGSGYWFPTPVGEGCWAA